MRRFLAVPLIVASAAMVLAGCASGGGSSAGSTSGSSGNGGSSSSNPYGVTKDAALAKTLPASIAKSGEFRVGVDPTYAPNEFKDANGNIVGWDVDLGNAIAETLGVKAVWTQSNFDNIIPGITGGRYDLGISSFTDTTVREKQVDFVNYYNAGILWATQKGKSIDPNNACGIKVAVEAGTTEALQEVPAKSKACVAAGKKPIQIMKYQGQDGATNALVLGQVQAMSADSPITEYAVKQQSSKIQVAGSTFDVAPYGIAVEKGSPLTEVIKNTVQHLIDDGVYGKILTKWGVEADAVKTAQINEASKQ